MYRLLIQGASKSQKLISELIDIKSNINMIYEDYYNQQLGNSKKVQELEVKLKKDDAFNEIARKAEQYYSGFSSGFSLAMRALMTKAQDFSRISDPKCNLWYNEFRMFNLLASFSRYYMKEYVIPLLKVDAAVAPLASKMIQSARQILSHCSSWLTKGGSQESSITRNFESLLAKLVKDNQTDFLQLVDQQYQPVISRTLQEGLESAALSLSSKSKRFIKFFENYAIRPKNNFSLFEYLLKGQMVCLNEVREVCLILDVVHFKQNLDTIIVIGLPKDFSDIEVDVNPLPKFSLILMKPACEVELSLKHHSKQSELVMDYNKDEVTKERLKVYIQDSIAASDFIVVVNKIWNDLSK